MSSTTPTTVNEHVILPTSKHTHTVIFLHGRGSTATEFESELFESQASDDRFFVQIFPSVKWVFPSATPKWTETEEEVVNQWFDMKSVQHPNDCPETQKPGLRESVQMILEVVRRESAAVGLKMVFLAGISQGCATALLALLLGGVEIGGFVGLSGWLPMQEELGKILNDTTSTSQERTQHLRALLDIPVECYSMTSKITSAVRTPVLLQHAVDDFVVPVANGLGLAKTLQEFGMQVAWQCFDEGGHWLNEPEGMDRIVKFLRTHMVVKYDANKPGQD